MVRQNPVSNHQETSQAGDPELARWLTRDLRPKGAPLSSPPPSASAPPPSEAEVLAGWLTQDLTPKNSLLPRASVSPALSSPAAPLRAVSSPPISFPASPFRDVRGSESPAPVASPLPPAAAPVQVAAASPAAPAAFDSSTPQVVVTPEPPSLPVVAPAALEEDDLAVLPGRRRTEGSDRKKYAFVLLGVLCFAAAIGLGIRQRGSGDAGSASSVASATDESGALPPPPPSADELLAVPEPTPAAPPRRAKTSSDEPDDALDPLDPRNALGGPSVRRYADVPSPTLSRLAREQRRLQRERDEAQRKAKAKEIPR